MPLSTRVAPAEAASSAAIDSIRERSAMGRSQRCR
jgi:hypothetical protein